MYGCIGHATFFVLLASALSVTNATVISYDLDYLGDESWRYRYTIENDSLVQPIRGVTIYFNDLSGSDSPA